MRILAIGDFHGTFPKKFKKIINSKNVDAIISIGDYLPFFYRALWFKHCYGKDIALWEVIGKKRARSLVNEDIRRGEKLLKKLNELKIPVYTVLGNVDYPSPDDIMDYKKGKDNKLSDWDNEQLNLFSNRLKKYKNIVRFDYRFAKLGEYILIGMRGHSNPGKVKSKAFRKYKVILNKLFNRFREENKRGKVIFVSHNIPYNTNLDKIKSKKAHAKVKGKHYGSKLARKIVNKFQPILALGGHIHEGKGMQKIGKTIVVNCGSAHEGEGVLIDLNGRVSTKFL